MLLVMLWHAGVPLLPGGYVGVDVFFVISGFLITGLLVREIGQTGRLSIRAFYARRVRRLLPGAGATLVFCALVSWLVLPPVRWSQTGWDIVSSAGYLVNWRLAERSVDYLAADSAPSIVQHFWSLAVEEQFYLVWPAFLVLATLGARRLRGGAHQGRAPLLVAVALVTGLSLVWSGYFSAVDPGRGYFHSTTRAWELGLGAALAIAAPWLRRTLHRLPVLACALLGWCGFAAIVASASLLRTSTVFPGYAALLPTLGAAAVIMAGLPSAMLGPARLLSVGVCRGVGAMSYSLYLWHWPLLVVAVTVWGEEQPWPRLLGVVAFTFLPAFLSYRYIEMPFRSPVARRMPEFRVLRCGLVFTLVPVVAGVLLPWGTWLFPGVPTRADTTVVARGGPASGAPGPLGAAVLADPPFGDPAGAPADRVNSIVPDPLAASRDLPGIYRLGCTAEFNDRVPKGCVLGNRDADFTMALVGDSHAAQWEPALEEIAREKNIRLTVYVKSACPFIAVKVAHRDREYRDCTQWNEAVSAKLLGSDKPDLLVTSSTAYVAMRDGKSLHGEANRTAIIEGLRETWGSLVDAGITTYVIRNTPGPDVNIPECVSSHPTQLTRCAFDREAAIASMGPLQVAAAEGMAGVHLIDLNDAICPASRCPAVIGGVLLFWDSDHLTATYVSTLTPRLRRLLEPDLSPG